VAQGDLPQVEMMLRDHALATAATPEGTPALLLALYKGHQGVARAIASRRSSLELYECAALGDAERVRAALDRHPELANQRAPDGNTALGLATQFAHVPVMELLLGQGADPNLAADNDTRTTPLHTAAGNTQPGVAFAMIHLLLNHSANPNARALGGWTPLHTAAALGYRDACAILVSCGADPGTATDAGKTAAQVAEDFGFSSVAEWLQRALGGR
jgi:ankyrin repeat protein